MDAAPAADETRAASSQAASTSAAAADAGAGARGGRRRAGAARGRGRGRGAVAARTAKASTGDQAGDGGGEDGTLGDGYDDSEGGSDLVQEEDPYYDDAADDKDATWADQQRCGRVSDALLSCPACFTMLCMDCQRHDKFHHQYRAMFVMNCRVGDDPEGAGEGAASASGQAGAPFDPSGAATASGGGRGGRRPKRAKPSAQYQRVCCGVCGTEVGAYEPDTELYHFYHVFPSNA
ncbi:hypothetical protein HYH03_018516 [Edaphochlamys debaryana]|uniref:E2F-associated phosphoprotein n=1 Tax=Edaphochlamys debaryana TaxID=47281 RepID=A0A835XGD3_9CHLO|nr:hypothetical protein HYH03_018516 [Edaphochlamys debaryana]|eukprot:KAG2482557.1 hypothetical protein HYH03_018516 [Edaphochlamys debaryana]